MRERRVQSFAAMHWPGLYSIALGINRGGGLSRLFVALPGHLHMDLRDRERPFLHHAHAYDFRSTTVAGAVENDVFMEASLGDSAPLFHAYRFESVMARDEPKLERSHYTRLAHIYSDFCDRGESYELDHDRIHRVVFHPDPQTGWFAVRLDESAPKPRAEFCYSRHFMADIPYRDDLYQPIDESEARTILDRLAYAMDRRINLKTLEAP